MAINFNVNPYYDDYDEDKGFHRILFKPGVAVQARELTQLQTILQKQVERFGRHFFEDGAMVIPGQIAIDTNVKAVKLTTASVASTNLATLFSGLNKTIEGLTSGVEALVLLGLNAEGDDSPTLIIRFTKTGTDTTTNEFSLSETIRIKGTSTTFVTDSIKAVYPSSIASIQEGVYFVGKSFVKVLPQTIALDKYTSTPSYRIGLSLSENIVTEIDDSTLYDNAIGSPNESAPGADRYKIELVLSKLSLTSELDQDFYELSRIQNGTILKLVNKTQYSILEKTLARRTFDESGNYTVNPLKIQIREHRSNNRGAWSESTAYIKNDIVTYNGNTYIALTDATSSSTPPTHGFGEATAGVKWLFTKNPPYNLGVYTPEQGGDEAKLALGLEPGKVYINGYEVEKIATQYVPVTKARSTRSVVDEEIDTVIGNYVLVSNVWSSATGSFTEFVTANLYDRITVTSGSAAGNKVGTATIRGIYYHSGNASLSNSIFKLSLFDINMDAGKSLERNVKQIQTGSMTADVAGVYPAWSWSNTVSSDDYKTGWKSLTGTISGSSTTVTGVGTTFTTDLAVGDFIYVDQTRELRRVTAIASDYSLTIEAALTTGNTGSKFSLVQMPLYEPENVPALFEFPFSVLKQTSSPTYYIVKTFYQATNGSGEFVITSNAVNQNAVLSDYVIVNGSTGRPAKGTAVNYPSATAFTITGLAPSTNHTVLAPITKTTSAKTKTPVTSSKLITNNLIYSASEISLDVVDAFAVDSVSMITSTGNVDITEWYSFDNGQRSTHYGISKLIRNPRFPAPSSNVRIDYRYFSHGTTGDYFDVSSYSQIPYQFIPVFYGDNYIIRLSDVLDFRPVANVSLKQPRQYDVSSLPHRNFKTTISYEHYLPRVDKVSIDLRGNIFSVTGAPAVFAKDPPDPVSGMNLYKINLAPYTLNTNPPSITYETIDNKRYTMRDIGELEKRLENVEYYTALSLLEQDTASLSIRDQFGLERFKNGFIVDNFEGHGVGDTNSQDYRCAIDMENNILRPFYTMDNINLVETDTTTRTTNNYQVTGDLATLKYSDVVLVNQSYASRVENVNPFAVASFIGRMDLNPPSDEWFETDVRPEIIVNEEGNFDAVATALESSGALGTIWNAWQTQWIGTPATLGTRTETAVIQSGLGADFDQRFGVGRQVNPWAGPEAGRGVGVRSVTLQTQTQQLGLARSGVRTSVVARLDRRVVDDRIVSTATIPFIRSRILSIVGRNFKPNTRLYSFFDEVNVSSYITPAANVAVTPLAGTFSYEVNADAYGEETDRDARKVNGNSVSAFNRGDIIYVKKRGASTYTLTTTPGSAILAYYGTGNVMYLHNIKGTLQSSDEVLGTISGANATLGATVSAPAQGSSLVTNANGDFAATFTIPNTSALRFRTGTRDLVLTDSVTNNRLLANTQGRVSYSASGTLQTRQATIASTRNAQVVREVLTQTDTIAQTSENITNDTGWYDPLAQTFLIDVKNGCFITKIDIFFSQKDSSLPVTLEIRNTVNGYPGKRILPFSSVTLRPDQVTTSADASSATTFTFKSPIYLEENGEYCIVLLSDSTEYKVWISQLGDDAIGTDRRISQQPYAGVLFKSQNASTWTADQLQDLKFKLYRASFDTSKVGVVSFVNESIPTKLLPYNALQLTDGSNVITVNHPAHGMQSGANVILSGFANVYNLTDANVNIRHKISNVLIDSYTITANGGPANATVVVGSGNIRVTEDIVFNVMNPIVEYRNFTGTEVSFKANTAAATFFSARGSSPVSVIANENNYFTSPQAIKATTNESSTSGSIRKSFELRAELRSTSENLSPVIDINRTSLVAISNQIDSITSNTANFLHDNVVTLSANTKVRFEGNAISTNHPDVANVLGSLSVGKTLTVYVAGSSTNNANVVVSKVTNNSGIANVETYYTFSTEAPGNSVTLTQKSRFTDERAYVGGSAASKYVTKQVNLANPSKYLKIMFAANIPTDADVDVYYRTLPVGSLDNLSEFNYTLISPTDPIRKTDAPSEFFDIAYEADSLPQFSAVSVKIVMRSTNSSAIPQIKDLRVVACP
jgi:hypothetical protein